jgi:hypothetical protein
MTTPPDRQPPPHSLEFKRHQLAAWLNEWSIEQTLPIEFPALTRPPPDRNLAAAPAYHPARRARACVPGQIRLIHPATHDDVCLPPLYVAVLDPVPPDNWWVVPFGRFSVPAVPSEWRTGLTAMPLRVLCLWNTRRVPGRALTDRSWPAGKLSARLLAQARLLITHASVNDRRMPHPDGPQLPDRTAADLGPPLLHPQDPRWAYLAQEADRIETILAAAGLTRNTASSEQVRSYPLPGDSMLKAAEDKPDFDGNPP